jgi:hypothetical protein
MGGCCLVSELQVGCFLFFFFFFKNNFI